jgi:hypothetical protein
MFFSISLWLNSIVLLSTPLSKNLIVSNCSFSFNSKILILRDPFLHPKSITFLSSKDDISHSPKWSLNFEISNSKSYLSLILLLSTFFFIYWIITYFFYKIIKF